MGKALQHLRFFLEVIKILVTLHRAPNGHRSPGSLCSVREYEQGNQGLLALTTARTSKALLPFLVLPVVVSVVPSVVVSVVVSAVASVVLLPAAAAAAPCSTKTQLPKLPAVLKDTKHWFPVPPVHCVPAGSSIVKSWVPVLVGAYTKFVSIRDSGTNNSLDLRGHHSELR